MQITVRSTPAELKSLPWWDNTKLVAMNTCPTWATVTYHRKRALFAGGRALALEAGAISHEVFAAVRLYDLYRATEDGPWRGRLGDDHRELVRRRGAAMFGGDRWNEVLSVWGSEDDHRTQLVRSAIHLLNTSGYYDEPNDRRRTLTNIEEACIAYIDNYPLGVYLPVIHDDFLGIEVPIDVIVEADGATIRFVGKVDALCWDRTGKHVEIHENKTGSRIDAVWCAGYDMSHQVTGYCVATSAMLADMGLITEPVSSAIMWGMAIPQPRSTLYGGVLRHPTRRDEHTFERWARWLVHTVRIGEQAFAQEDVTKIEKYTHSCNRYFRACSLIPMCDSPSDEAREMLEGMVERDWNPLHEEKGGD